VSVVNGISTSRISSALHSRFCITKSTIIGDRYNWWKAHGRAEFLFVGRPIERKEN